MSLQIRYIQMKIHLLCLSEDYTYLHSHQIWFHICLYSIYWNLKSSIHRCTLNSFIHFFSLICNLTSSATVQRMPRTSKPLSEIPIRTAGEAHNVSLWTWCCKNAGATGKHLYPHLFLFLMGQQDVRRVIYVLLHLTVYAGCGKVDLPAFIWKIIQ